MKSLNDFDECVRELAIEYIKYTFVRSYVHFTVVNHTVFRSAIYAVLCDNVKRLFGFVPFNIIRNTHTQQNSIYMNIGDGLTMKLFFSVGFVTTPGRTHTHARTQKWWVLRKMARYSHPSGFSILWIKSTINLLYWTLLKNFAWKSYFGTHIHIAGCDACCCQHKTYRLNLTTRCLLKLAISAPFTVVQRSV